MQAPGFGRLPKRNRNLRVHVKQSELDVRGSERKEFQHAACNDFKNLDTKQIRIEIKIATFESGIESHY